MEPAEVGSHVGTLGANVPGPAGWAVWGRAAHEESEPFLCICLLFRGLRFPSGDLPGGWETGELDHSRHL